MDADGGDQVEYGQQTVAEQNDFSEKQYESDDPNDDENGYDGDYNTPETDHPDGEDEESEEEEKAEGGDDEDDSFIQAFAKAKAKYASKKKTKKGWGNVMDADGGDQVEYGQQTVAEQNDFSEKQYESDDPNDDENGYDGDYNTPETDHPDGEDEEESA